MSLQHYRKDIDDLDDQLLTLLNKRAEIALKIAKEKFDHRIGVLAANREEEIYKRLNEVNQGPLKEQHIREIFAAIISSSKKLQHLYQSFEDI
jgi:chorismate mutase